MQRAILTIAGAALCLWLAILSSPRPTRAQTSNPLFIDIGQPTLTDLWVDPVNGDDSNQSASREQSLRTLNAAWNRIPQNKELITGYRIRLAAGVYSAADIPRYWASHYGMPQAPIIIQSADGPLPGGGGAARIEAFVNLFDCRYLYLIDLNITTPFENVVHIEGGHHTLLRNVVLNGQGVASQVLKVNQSSDLYVEGCEIFGAIGTAADFVAVQRAHVVASSIHDAGSWALLLKGGSAYCLIEGNEFYHALRGGFAAGQTTGFEFMVEPWLHYEAYGIKFVNNLIHDVDGSGMAVNGGYDVLLAHNTLYRVGKTNYLLEIAYGQRVCSSDVMRCGRYLTEGGWGTTGTSSGDIQPIPNRNVFVYNNIFYNPPDTPTSSAHFIVYGPQMPAANSHIAAPAQLDTNLQIRGNIVWNGEADRKLGIEYTTVGCQATNPTCNDKQLRADNVINLFEPKLIDPTRGNYRPAADGRVIAARTFTMPEFDWLDVPTTPNVPRAGLSNTVARDRVGLARGAASIAGAYSLPLATTVSAANYRAVVAPDALVSAFGANLATGISVAGSGPLPTSLGGTSVTVRDAAGVARLAPLFLVSPNQINYAIPSNVGSGIATVSIVGGDGLLAMGRIEIAGVAPALFSADASGRGWAAAAVLRVRTGGAETYESTVRFDPAQNRLVAVPIDLSNETDRVFLVLYGTGLRNRSALSNVHALVGGVEQTTLYAGAQGALVGLDQINLNLSRNLMGRGDVDVVLTIDGQVSNTVRVSIK